MGDTGSLPRQCVGVCCCTRRRHNGMHMSSVGFAGALALGDGVSGVVAQAVVGFQW